MILLFALLMFVAAVTTKGSATQQCVTSAIESEFHTIYTDIDHDKNLRSPVIWRLNSRTIYHSEHNPPLTVIDFTVDLTHPWRLISIKAVQKYHAGTFELFSSGTPVWKCHLEVIADHPTFNYIKLLDSDSCRPSGSDGRLVNGQNQILIEFSFTRHPSVASMFPDKSIHPQKLISDNGHYNWGLLSSSCDFDVSRCPVVPGTKTCYCKNVTGNDYILIYNATAKVEDSRAAVRFIWDAVNDSHQEGVTTDMIALPVVYINHVLEVYFVVDRRAINRYEGLSTAITPAAKLADAKAKINADIDYIITEVNTLFSSLANYGNYSVNIKVAKRKVKLLDNNVFPEEIISGGKQVNSEDGLKTFGKYLKSDNSYATLNYDLSVLWTGFHIIGNDKNRVLGWQHRGNVCQGENATSIVAFDGTYETVVVIAYQLAQSLGAHDDGYFSGYAMVPFSFVKYKSNNRWKFSLCTAIDVSGFIGKLKSNCLLTAHSASVVPSSSITDNLNNGISMCQQSLNNKDSFACMIKGLYNGQVPTGDVICKIMYCYRKGKECSRTYTPEGMFCGKGKSCRLGKCVDDPRPEAQEVDDTCLFGDQPFRALMNTTCSELYKSKPHECYDESTYLLCCDTCKQHKTGLAGCEWGDRRPDCASRIPTPAFCFNNGAVCCKTCQGVVRKRSADTDNEEIPEILLPEAPSVLTDLVGPSSEDDDDNDLVD